MIEFWIKRKGSELHPATPTDFEHFKDLPEGVSVKVKASSNSRSNKHLRLFFGAIAKAFFNWPEDHEFKPQNDHHLRSWLLCKARHCSIETHELEDSRMAETVAHIVSQSLEAAKPYGFAVYNHNLVYVLRPKSISNESEPEQKEFNKISQAVSDILKAEINMSLDDFKNREAA